jgi:hypothetical protein
MDWTKVIEAGVGVISSLAWPAAAVVMLRMVLKRYRDGIGRLIDRVKTVTYPGGQVDLLEAAEGKRAEVASLVEQVAAGDADEESRRAAGAELAVKAEQVGKISALAWLRLHPTWLHLRNAAALGQATHEDVEALNATMRDLLEREARSARAPAHRGSPDGRSGQP